MSRRIQWHETDDDPSSGGGVFVVTDCDTGDVIDVIEARREEVELSDDTLAQSLGFAVMGAADDGE